MKNRRSFLKATSTGIVSTIMVSLPQFALAANDNSKGVVKNADEGEIYFVRENISITIKVSKKVDGIDSTSICTEKIQPGGGIPVHKHLFNDEIFFIHKGSGSFILDDQEFKISEGSNAFVPKGVWHGLRNTGSEILFFSFGFSPSGFEDFFRQIGTPQGTAFKAKPQDE